MLSAKLAKLFPSRSIILVAPIVFKLYTSTFLNFLPSRLKMRVWHVSPLPALEQATTSSASASASRFLEFWDPGWKGEGEGGEPTGAVVVEERVKAHTVAEDVLRVDDSQAPTHGAVARSVEAGCGEVGVVIFALDGEGNGGGRVGLVVADLDERCQLIYLDNNHVDQSYAVSV